MSRFCPRHRAWLLADADAPLQLWAQLAEADEAGVFNSPAMQIERWHAALELTEILLASGRAEALPCLLVADAEIREMPWQWPGLAGLLRHLERLVTLVRREQSARSDHTANNETCSGSERSRTGDHGANAKATKAVSSEILESGTAPPPTPHGLLLH